MLGPTESRLTSSGRDMSSLPSTLCSAVVADARDCLKDILCSPPLVSGTCLSLALIVPIFFDMKIFSTQDILVSGGLAALGMISMGVFQIYKTDSRQVGGYFIGILSAAFSIFLILSGLL